MYASSRHNVFVFSHILHGIEQHKLTAVVGLFALASLLYVLNNPITPQSGMYNAPDAGVSASTGVKPLTLVDNPQFAHEYDIRVHAIHTHLEALQYATQADSVYLLSYAYRPDRVKEAMELTIASIFDVSREGLPHRMQDLRGLSRKNWRHLTRASSSPGDFLPDPVPQNSGIELYNDQGGVIGYLGMDYWGEDEPFVWDDDLPLLRQTALFMKIALVQSLEHVQSSVAH